MKEITVRNVAQSRRLIGMFIALLTALTGLVAVDAQPSNAAVDKKVIIHYNRPGNDYRDWNVWLWADGVNGAAYQFSKTGSTCATDDYGVCGEWTVPGSAGSQAVGFIIRTDNWDKDPDGDRSEEHTSELQSH